jgi:predicted O-methyltransferase YrrM
MKAQRYANAILYHDDSLAVAKTIPDRSLDFVFIDAEHTTEAVLSDVQAWRDKVRPGGLILGHDEQWPSVQRALKSLFAKWTKHDDNVWSHPA